MEGAEGAAVYRGGCTYFLLDLDGELGISKRKVTEYIYELKLLTESVSLENMIHMAYQKGYLTVSKIV